LLLFVSFLVPFFAMCILLSQRVGPINFGDPSKTGLGSKGS
jgi:hypothetical protein